MRELVLSLALPLSFAACLPSSSCPSLLFPCLRSPVLLNHLYPPAHPHPPQLSIKAMAKCAEERKQDASRWFPLQSVQRQSILKSRKKKNSTRLLHWAHWRGLFSLRVVMTDVPELLSMWRGHLPVQYWRKGLALLCHVTRLKRNGMSRVWKTGEKQNENNFPSSETFQNICPAHESESAAQIVFNPEEDRCPQACNTVLVCTLGKVTEITQDFDRKADRGREIELYKHKAVIACFH